MSKANKVALNWLPKRKDGRKRFYQCNDDDIRSIYAKGYRKAEKDLELTVEDIVHIIETYNELEFSREFTTVTFNDTCKEVLKRFNKERKEK